ncbi:transposase [Ligilactobacillus ruminis ATCC 27782]|uniref:Transposase n=1 Tax=Ligilactobacillus ruminis (strain ATCC 27782 / RF3) TaxID=1069534 RepID=G2SNK4_LIGR2|nr:transposase [Ligilactobacillus ruminis ATCC 27782]
MLKGHVETVKRTLYEIASKYGFTMAHMEIGKDDHIHLLVSALPELSVTNIMRWLKEISARQLFRECRNCKPVTGRSRIVICGHRVTMLKASAQSMNRLLPGILMTSVEKW